MMAHVCVREELPASRDVVWSLVRDFRDLSAWAPQGRVVSVEGDGVGAIRRVDTDMGPFVERCEAHDEEGFSFSYAVLESAIPFRNYVAVVRLEDRGPERCGIEWSCDFDADPDQVEPLVGMIESVYRDGFIASLRKTLRER